MAADGLTKALGAVKFKEFRSLVGLSRESLDIEGKDSSEDDDFSSKDE